MVGILLLLTRALTVDNDEDSAHMSQPSSRIVQPIPESALATHPRLCVGGNFADFTANIDGGLGRDAEADDDLKLPEVQVTTSGSQISPSPAIFNQSGLNAVMGLWLDSFAGSLQRLQTWFLLIVDESKDPKDLSPVTPEIEEILAKWEAANPVMKTARIQFTQVTYVLVFEVEKVAEGEMLYDSPRQFSLSVRGVPPAANAKGTRVGPRGDMFRLESDRAGTWIWDQNRVLTLDDEAKTYDCLMITEPGDRSDISSNPHIKPIFRSFFLLDINAEQIRKRWEMSDVVRKGDSVILKATPRMEALRSSGDVCRVMIDTRTWQTRAIKLVDGTSHVETVYSIKGRTLNKPLPANFTPNLRRMGYKLNGLLGTK